MVALRRQRPLERGCRQDLEPGTSIKGCPRPISEASPPEICLLDRFRAEYARVLGGTELDKLSSVLRRDAVAMRLQGLKKFARRLDRAAEIIETTDMDLEPIEPSVDHQVQELRQSL